MLKFLLRLTRIFFMLHVNWPLEKAEKSTVEKNSYIKILMCGIFFVNLRLWDLEHLGYAKNI